MSEITIQPVGDETKERYAKSLRAIKRLKITAYKVVPYFLCDMLEADERTGFKLIKKIWEKNAARKLV